MQALDLGALDFISKPKVDLTHQLGDYADDIIAKVKMAASVPVSSLVRTFNSTDTAQKTTKVSTTNT